MNLHHNYQSTLMVINEYRQDKSLSALLTIMVLFFGLAAGFVGGVVATAIVSIFDRGIWHAGFPWPITVCMIIGGIAPIFWCFVYSRLHITAGLSSDQAMIIRTWDGLSKSSKKKLPYKEIRRAAKEVETQTDYHKLNSSLLDFKSSEYKLISANRKAKNTTYKLDALVETLDDKSATSLEMAEEYERINKELDALR